MSLPLSPLHLTGSSSQTNQTKVFATPDLLKHIFSFLPPTPTLALARRVCRNWNTIPYKEHLDCTILGEMSDDRFKTIIEGLTHHAPGLLDRRIALKSIDLSGCKKITNKSLEYIALKTYSLGELNVTGCAKITDKGLEHLKQTRIKSLNLAGCNKITDQGLFHLSEMKFLTALNLSMCNQFTEAGIKNLVSLSIESLNLTRCLQLSLAYFQQLANFSTLTSLNLTGCNQLKDEELAALSKLRSLNFLNLQWCTGITGEGFRNLKVPLKSLNLRECTGIRKNGWKHLAKMPLESLSLADCNHVQDESLELLSDLPLTMLNLTMCKDISNIGIKHLVRIKGLQSLILTGCELADEDLEDLGRMTSLKTLILHWCVNITNRGLSYLTSLNLEHLNLAFCRHITVEGLAYLDHMPLTHLDLVKCSEICHEGLAAFKAGLSIHGTHREKIDYFVYVLAQHPKGGDRWGEYNRYKDLDRLKLAVALAKLPEHSFSLILVSMLNLIDREQHSEFSPENQEEIEELLAKAPEHVRHQLDEQVYVHAPDPKGGDRWGEFHRFDNRSVLRLAVMTVLKNEVLPCFLLHPKGNLKIMI